MDTPTINPTTIIMAALQEACKWIRQNPPAYFPDDDYEMHLRICCGGLTRDPDGNEYVNYFIAKGLDKLLAETSSADRGSESEESQ